MEVMQNVEGMAKAIGLTPSTVKKYYLLFEQEGYKFKRSNEGHILFSEHDIELFKELVALKNEKGMTVSKAVKQLVKNNVITDTTDIAVTTNDITIMTKQITTVMTEISELKDMLQKQNEYIEKLQKYIESSLERRDKILMQSIREQQETKKQIMESLKEIAATAAQNEKKKKGFFARLFGK